MIISSYEGRIAEKGIDFQCSVRIPSELVIPDSDLSSILSNALENAVHAAAMPEEGMRRIILDMRMNNDKLLVEIKNTYLAEPRLVDGMPHADEVGHGFGTQSIYYVTKKLKGQCRYSIENEYFVLRIVL